MLEHLVFSQASFSDVVEDKNWHSNATSFKTRWWSKWEVRNQVMEFFGDVEPFLRENDNLSPVCRASLLEIFDDPVTARDLDIELAAMIDAGKHFVQATYYLEGDGLLVFTCYERLSA